MGLHNKGTYTRVLTYAYTRICIRVYAYRHTRIRKIRAYNTRMCSSDISELHCNYLMQFCTSLQNTTKKTESVLETHEHLSYSQFLSTGKIIVAALSYKQVSPMGGVVQPPLAALLQVVH